MDNCNKCNGLIIVTGDSLPESDTFHYEEQTAVVDTKYPEGFCVCGEESEE